MRVTEFGNPLLRLKTNDLNDFDIKSAKIQQLIKDMKLYLEDKKMGVGLAAPQIGESLSLAIIQIKPTKTRPEADKFDLVIINPQITQTYGRKNQLWEGCISAGPLKSGLFAKVSRYKKIKLKYVDENSKSQEKIFEGLAAHVIQHEVDHLNGILFVDRVKDRKSFSTYKEYLNSIKKRHK